MNKEKYYTKITLEQKDDAGTRFFTCHHVSDKFPDVSDIRKKFEKINHCEKINRRSFAVAF